MKIKIEKEESLSNKHRNIDLYKTLKSIPFIIQSKLQFIQKEIDEIVAVLDHYEHLKEKFNNQHLNIQSYIDEFLKGIKLEAEFIYNENKKVESKVKTTELPEIYCNENISLSELGEKKEIPTTTQSSKEEKEIINTPTKKSKEKVEVEEINGIAVLPGENINLRMFEQEGVLPLSPEDLRELERFDNRRG